MAHPPLGYGFISTNFTLGWGPWTLNSILGKRCFTKTHQQRSRSSRETN